MGVDAVRRAACFACVLYAGLLLGACDEEEGCLDYRALSVSLYAEQACEDCCVYPALALQQLPGSLVGGARVGITRTTPIAGADGDTAVIAALLYFLHDVGLEFEDGTVVGLTDTFGFRQNESLDFELADRSLLRARPLQTSVLRTGDLLREGTVVALRFSFGLPADVAEADPTAQGTSSPLSLTQSDTLLSEGSLAEGRQLRSAYVSVVRTDGTRDSSWVSGAASLPFRLPLGQPTPLRRSYNLNLALLLPVAPLVDLPAGPVPAEVFAGAFLDDASVIGVSLSR